MAVDGSHVIGQSHVGVIEVRVPAEVDRLVMLRAVAETVLLTADFTLDVVTDVRVALDEVATALILDATPGAELACEFRYDSGEVRVRVATVTETDAALTEQSVGWHLLDALTDTIRTTCDGFDDELHGYPVAIHFSKVGNED